MTKFEYFEKRIHEFCMNVFHLTGQNIYQDWYGEEVTVRLESVTGITLGTFQPYIRSSLKGIKYFANYDGCFFKMQEQLCEMQEIFWEKDKEFFNEQ